MSDTFTVADVGRSFYTASGEKVRLEAVLGPDQYDQHVVTRTITIYSGDEVYDEVGDMYMVDRLFRKAPIAKKSEELEDLLKAITAAKIELATVNAKIHETEKNSKEVLKRCAAFPALCLALDYLEGNTDKWVCVTVNYRSCTLHKLTEYLTYEDAYDYKNRLKLKLLSLFGNTHGQVTWGMSAYADGSGSTTTLYIFGSDAEAQNFILERVSKEISDALHNGNLWAAKEWADNHPKAATPEQQERLDAFRLDNLKASLVKSAEDVSKATKEFEKIKGELKAAKTGGTDGLRKDEDEDANRDTGTDFI